MIRQLEALHFQRALNLGFGRNEIAKKGFPLGSFGCASSIISKPTVQAPSGFAKFVHLEETFSLAPERKGSEVQDLDVGFHLILYV